MRSIVSFALIASAFVAGCASDPNKEVKAAQAEEAEAIRERQEQAADNRKDARQDYAEQQKDQQERMADKLPDGTDSRVSAQANMRAEREKYQADVAARLDKAHARLQEARRRVDIGGAKTPTEVRSKISAAEKQHEVVATEARGLAGAPNEGWKDRTKTLDSHLDELDKMVDEAHNKATSIKH